MTGPTLRQAVEGMALGFDPRAAAGRAAVLEFDAPAERPRLCHLVVDGRGCRFGAGPAERPTLRLRTDGDTWRSIGAGQLDAGAALADGRLSAEGDAGLLLQLPRWFRRLEGDALRDPGAHTPGPVRLPAMAWLAVALVPWKALWLALALGHARAGILAGAALALAVAAYRRWTGAATFFEGATGAVFGAAALAALAGAPTSGPVLAASFAALAAIWAAAAALRPLGLTGEYARWEYLPALAGTTLFRHPNVLLTLLWAGAFLANAALALSPLARGGRALGMVLHACILAACAAITARRRRGASTLRVDDIDRRLAAMRGAAAGVAAAAVGMFAYALRA